MYVVVYITYSYPYNTLVEGPPALEDIEIVVSIPW
jgi:hypothetical protein